MCLPSKVKVEQVLTVSHTTARVDLHAHLIDTAVLKQCNIRIEQQFTDYMKPLSCYTTSINTWLSYEFKSAVVVLLAMVVIVLVLVCT
jgi:hypothetical protein